MVFLNFGDQMELMVSIVTFFLFYYMYSSSIYDSMLCVVFYVIAFSISRGLANYISINDVETDE